MTTALKIDVDYIPDNKYIDLYIKTRLLILRELGYNVERYTYAFSRKGLHIYIIIKEDIEPEQTLLLQWLLGDDPVRVKINHYRLKKGKFPELNILFNTVRYVKPVEERCMKCKLYNYVISELIGEKIPRYKAEITGINLEKAFIELADIAYAEPLAITYKVEDKKLIVYSPYKEDLEKTIKHLEKRLGNLKSEIKVI